jgi:hypothetical protein
MTAGLTVHRHNGEMLRVALWGVRVTGLAVVGLLTFLSPPSAPLPAFRASPRLPRGAQP